MSALFQRNIDRDGEYKKLHGRKIDLAAALGITLERRVIDANRYEEKGKEGTFEITFYSEGEGSPAKRKQGYFEVLKLNLTRFSPKTGDFEESISLNYENSEMYTSFRDRDFWLEYAGTDLPGLKDKFGKFRDSQGESLAEHVLREFARVAERATKLPGQEVILFSTLNTSLDGIEELMHQVLTGNFSKKLVIPERKEQPPPPPPAKVEKPAPSQEPPPAKAEPKPEPKPEPKAEQKQEPGDAGMALLLQQKYEEAVDFYKTKAKKSPKDPGGWFGLTACLFLTGDIKKCTLYYNKCLEIDPSYEIFSQLVKLAPDDETKLLDLAERFIDIEMQTEAKKYLEFLDKKTLQDKSRKKLESLQKKL
ncbi:MAG: hypothetical protein RDV48_04665 [Candidatus Eremiobacteraeota bacterium]|nr:hypothetical protein [Candidatus Eremiobacteraeota bacterium]